MMQIGLWYGILSPQNSQRLFWKRQQQPLFMDHTSEPRYNPNLVSEEL